MLLTNWATGYAACANKGMLQERCCRSEMLNATGGGLSALKCVAVQALLH